MYALIFLLWKGDAVFIAGVTSLWFEYQCLDVKKTGGDSDKTKHLSVSG